MKKPETLETTSAKDWPDCLNKESEACCACRYANLSWTLLTAGSGHYLLNICFKQHFAIRYLVIYNPIPPRMFLSLDLLSEYGIQHGAIGPLYVTSSYSTWLFCRGVSGFATDCPCSVWCRGLTTCLLHVGPPFRNRFSNNSWAVGWT